MNKSINDTSGPIGVFDSGVGGLTVLRELQTRLPNQNFIYLGDMARTPYGSKGQETIIRYSRECAHFLLRNNVKLIVVACNTASSLALDVLQAELPCPVIGTISGAAILAAESTKQSRVGVIGTEATVASDVYAERIRSLRSTIQVTSVACPLFVPLVEQGMFEGEIVDKIIELYLAPLREREIDTLVLGCTHYPLLSKALQQFFGEKVQLVECSKVIASDVGAMMDSGQGVSRAETQYYVTDAVPRFNRVAELFYGSKMVAASAVEIVEK